MNNSNEEEEETERRIMLSRISQVAGASKVRNNFIS